MSIFSKLITALAAIGHHDAEGLARFNRASIAIPPDVARELIAAEKLRKGQ